VIPLGPGLSLAEDELSFKATRSGGPGGQNVNKVATRVELIWEPASSPSLTASQRGRILEQLAGLLDKNGKLRIVASRGRTQAANRRLAIEKLKELLALALKSTKPRIPTNPTAGSKRRRLEAKQVRSAIKRARKQPPEPD